MVKCLGQVCTCAQTHFHFSVFIQIFFLQLYLLLVSGGDLFCDSPDLIDVIFSFLKSNPPQLMKSGNR